ncbi:MAG: hypothetical protein ACLUGF_05655 [Clostridium sp.]
MRAGTGKLADIAVVEGELADMNVGDGRSLEAKDRQLLIPLPAVSIRIL